MPTDLTYQQKVVLDALNCLASGTLAGLTGEYSYNGLDIIRGHLTRWYLDQCDEGVEFETWQDAWQAFTTSHPAIAEREGRTPCA